MQIEEKRVFNCMYFSLVCQRVHGWKRKDISSSGNEPEEEEFLAPPPIMASSPLRDVEKEEKRGK